MSADTQMINNTTDEVTDPESEILGTEYLAKYKEFAAAVDKGNSLRELSFISDETKELLQKDFNNDPLGKLEAMNMIMREMASPLIDLANSYINSLITEISGLQNIVTTADNPGAFNTKLDNIVDSLLTIYPQIAEESRQLLQDLVNVIKQDYQIALGVDANTARSYAYSQIHNPELDAMRIVSATAIGLFLDLTLNFVGIDSHNPLIASSIAISTLSAYMALSRPKKSPQYIVVELDPHLTFEQMRVIFLDTIRSNEKVISTESLSNFFSKIDEKFDFLQYPELSKILDLYKYFINATVTADQNVQSLSSHEPILDHLKTLLLGVSGYMAATAVGAITKPEAVHATMIALFGAYFVLNSLTTRPLPGKGEQ